MLRQDEYRQTLKSLRFVNTQQTPFSALVTAKVEL